MSAPDATTITADSIESDQRPARITSLLFGEARVYCLEIADATAKATVWLDQTARWSALNDRCRPLRLLRLLRPLHGSRLTKSRVAPSGAPRLARRRQP